MAKIKIKVFCPRSDQLNIPLIIIDSRTAEVTFVALQIAQQIHSVTLAGFTEM